MPPKLPEIRNVPDFQNFAALSASEGPAMRPGLIGHVYIELDFAHEYKYATSPTKARQFLTTIANAASATEGVAQAFGGFVLEVQGSTVHVGLSVGSETDAKIIEFAGAVHTVLTQMAKQELSHALSWRMAADAGVTLIVARETVHSDKSYVSLGDAANRPAKHLYRELDIREEDRNLKKFHLAIPRPGTKSWVHLDLNKEPAEFRQLDLVLTETRRTSVQIQLMEMREGLPVMASAAPLSPAGSPDSPSANDPSAFFGWVMRADLNGFTARVHVCQDDPKKLSDLALQFIEVMDAATDFTHNHEVMMIQLPWAGDNYTSAAIYNSKPDYCSGFKKAGVDLALDFDRYLGDTTTLPNNWAYSLAGGDVHGNAAGNVFIGSVAFRERRFLLGAGLGFGRTLQGFGDISPEGDEVVAWHEDVSNMPDHFKNRFKIALKTSGETSALYKKSTLDDLEEGLVEHKADSKPAITVGPSGTGKIYVKPHFDDQKSI